MPLDTSGESAVLRLGFGGFHREALCEPTYKGEHLVSGCTIKFPNYMKRKCFWKLNTGWLILKPKNLIPKNEYKEYMTTNVTYNKIEFVTWPTTKNNSLYAKKVKATIMDQKQDIKNSLVTPIFSPLYCMWVFHGDVYKGRYHVTNIEKNGIWIKRF